MKQYRVGHLAREMGVSADLLKLYEDYGVLEPQRDPDSQYRYYDIYHGGKVVSCLTLRNMGFTIRQTAELLEQADDDALAHALAERVAALEAERKRLDRLIPAVEDYTALCASFSSDQSAVEALRPGFWFLAQTSTEEFRQTERQKALARLLLDELPYSERLLVVDRASFLPGAPFRFQWGLALREDRAALWPTEEMTYLPPTPCRRYYETSPMGAVDRAHFLPTIAAEGRENTLLPGDLVCQVPISVLRGGERRGRRVLWFPL